VSPLQESRAPGPEVWTPESLARGAVAVIDLDALRHNLAVLRAAAPRQQVLAVVKADAYGHGLVPVARAAVEAGATWLGVALPDEALALRAAGVDARILSWLLVPESPFDALVAADVDITVSGLWSLDLVVKAVAAVGRPARVQLKLDSGLSRNGSTFAEWPELVAAARAAEVDGHVVVTGVWTHFANADVPTHASVERQLETFREAIALAEVAGLRPEVRHAANSAATFAVPEAHFDLVRVGIAMYGLSPGAGIGTADELGLRPVMTLLARLASAKRVPSGSGVSYGHLYTTLHETTLGVVPLGYADGIPRAASNVGPVFAAGRLRTIAGRVCMDQVVLDLDDADAHVGDQVVMFGAGGPSADMWGEVCGTIGYEIVTRLGPRVPRTYLGVAP